MNILVIDAGTSSMRGILYTEYGKALASHQRHYHVSYLDHGWAEQNPADWKCALYTIIKNISEKASDHGWPIDAIALTSQRSSVIPVDHSMHPLCNAIMWQDKRTSEICTELSSQNKLIFDLCGSAVNPVFSGSKMTWFRKYCPELYARTYKFMVIPDYLIYLMTGMICTDFTYGSRSHLMNLHTHQWDNTLLDLFWVDNEKLCPLTEPGSICGFTTKSFSSLTGCPEHIPVITSGGDQQCSAVGQGVIHKGILSVTAGTGAFLTAVADQLPENLHTDVICNASSIKNTYILEASLLTCSSAFDWFRRNFYENWSYEDLDREIRKAPAGANRCICLPYFQGRSFPVPDDSARGLFSNLTLNTRKCDMLRSLLEGICYEIRNGIQTIKQYTAITELYVNGGLTNSEPFNEMQCNIYGMPLLRRESTDSSAMGALMVAAAALGIYSSVESAFCRIEAGRPVRRYEPDPNLIRIYEKYRAEADQLYKKIYPKIPPSI